MAASDINGTTFSRFFGNSTAGNGHFFNGGRISFSDASTAGNGSFSTSHGTVNCEPYAGSVQFFDTSTAGNGTFTYAGADTTDGTPAFTVFLAARAQAMAPSHARLGRKAVKVLGSPSSKLLPLPMPRWSQTAVRTETEEEAFSSLMIPVVARRA